MYQLINSKTISIVKDRYRLSKKRLMLFDYDGTMVPFARNPAEAVPAPEIIRLLHFASADALNTTVIISGRTRQFLDHHLSLPGLTLIAEHGAFIRRPGCNWIAPIPFDSSWICELTEHLRNYSCPDSFIEIKESTVVWHYRECNTDDALQTARLIRFNVRRLFRNRNKPDILDGNKVIEFKPQTITKGEAVLKLLQANQYDFILALGDDINDEAMFRVLPTFSFTVKIGHGKTLAKFLLKAQADVIPFLEKIIH